MHPAQRALLCRQRIIDLRKRAAKPVSGEFLGAEKPGEKAALVTTLFQFDGVGAR